MPVPQRLVERFERHRVADLRRRPSPPRPALPTDWKSTTADAVAAPAGSTSSASVSARSGSVGARMAATAAPRRRRVDARQLRNLAGRPGQPGAVPDGVGQRATRRVPGCGRTAPNRGRPGRPRPAPRGAPSGRRRPGRWSPPAPSTRPPRPAARRRAPAPGIATGGTQATTSASMSVRVTAARTAAARSSALTLDPEVDRRVIGAPRRPASRQKSTASTPSALELPTMPTRLPAGTGWVDNSWATSKAVVSPGVRITPDCSNRVATAASDSGRRTGRQPRA